MKKIWKRVQSTNWEGVEELRWKQTRNFECGHRSHQGSRKMNRDKNASANIALNVILFAADELDDTTWKIGKM